MARLDREATLHKVCDCVADAGSENADLVVFGEALVPGYPFWLEWTNGAKFNSTLQKKLHSIYVDQAVCVEDGHLDSVCSSARKHSINVYLGIVERPRERGGHSLYCSLIFIDKDGVIKSVHRKLMPTYEERLCWGIGDGNGLRTHRIGKFTVGGLNCWENWMPMARTSLYAQGEDFHVSVWPGNKRNTEKLLPVLAQESRSFVLGVSGLFRSSDIPSAIPELSEMRENVSHNLANGGSCLVGPDGEFIIEPVIDIEILKTVELTHQTVREERQNFDSVGHYARPDVFQFSVSKERQSFNK